MHAAAALSKYRTRPGAPADYAFAVAPTSAPPAPVERAVEARSGLPAWTGAELPADPLAFWDWYRARFTAEHGFRFLKQDLGWTTVRPRDPHAADRWSWLLVLTLWQLWLARPLVADCRLPWERPLPPDRLTPGRVRRALAPALSRLGTPTRPVRRRGKAPGRQPGQRPALRTRHPVARRRPKRVA